MLGEEEENKEMFVEGEGGIQFFDILIYTVEQLFWTFSFELFTLNC